jgi:protein-tyrosine-phosphatase/predicted ATP-grasp superfamily ATP-dependent carboligase
VTADKVLVLGDDTRGFLATVRSLGRHGLIVHAAPANFRSPALRSRYIAAIHRLPPWMEEGAAWRQAIAELLRAERYALVIPCNETTLLPLHRHRAELAPLARLAIPDEDAIAALYDKHRTRELARRIGVPVAAGRLARPEDTAAHVLAEFGAPVVVKPRHSYTLDRLGARGTVRVVRDSARLQRLLCECDPDDTVIEQFFAGQGVGVSVLASRGRVLQAFEHHRVREDAGASFYRISAPLTPDLARACAAIVAALNYTGVAMFEFKYNPAGRSSGAWILLEVNARPWGSLPLPVALGVDFPYRWYRLLTAGEESPAVTYRTGVYGRNLLPDLQASLAEAAARRLGPVATAGFLIGRSAELLRPLTGREVHDVLVRDDPRPGLLELRDIARTGRRRLERLLPGAVGRRRRQARAQVQALWGHAGALRLIFVCQGNICRSPFAAALLRTRLGDGGIAAGSAGMMPQPGRPVPAFGVQAAAAHGIDLAAHRSAWLTPRMAESASLLVVFDETNRAALFDRYPDLKAPVIRLGDLARAGDIADPVDGDLDEFRRAYRQIATGIAELALLLPSAQP